MALSRVGGPKDRSLGLLVPEIENLDLTIIYAIVADYPEIRFFCLLLDDLI